jgi:hypothetical protein
MKTNRSARHIIKIRVITVCLAIAAIAAVDFFLGESLAERAGHTTGVQTDSPPVPNVSF